LPSSVQFQNFQWFCHRNLRIFVFQAINLIAKRFALCLKFWCETLDCCFHFRFEWMMLRWRPLLNSKLRWNKITTETRDLGTQSLIVDQ
jgi:hypothetical protein